MSTRPMKTTKLLKPLDLQILDAPIPVIGDDEVLCRVKRAGVCGTDHSIYTGNASFIDQVAFPMTLGHEWSGVVEKVGGSVCNFKPDDRVVGDTAVSCGKCYNCLTGLYSHCEQLRAVGTINTWDGAYAEYIVMPERHLFHLPDEVSFDNGALVEPAATALYSVVKADVKIGDTVLVLGSGPIGISAAVLAKLCGASKVVIAARKQNKLDMAVNLGVDSFINTTEVTLSEGAKKCFGNNGADRIIEASGSTQLFKEALDIVNNCGSISLVAFYDKPVEQVNLDSLVFKDVTISGSPGSLGMYKPVLNMMANKMLDLTPLITHRCNLEDTPEILDKFKTDYKEQVKIMIDL